MQTFSTTNLRNRYHQLWSYLIYWLKKEDKYSLQSPLLFRIYTELLDYISTRKKLDLDIEAYRKSLTDSVEIIEILDLGAGSKKVNTKKRKVADITRYSTSNRETAQLIQFFCTMTPAETVVELGTCVGISTQYLERVTNGRLATFEGANELVRLANMKLKSPKVDFFVGNMSQTLPEYLKNVSCIDFALIDANHTYAGSMDFINLILGRIHSKSIIVIGDIHWSVEMESAWKKITQFPEVKLSLDFYEVGVIFFDFPGDKTQYILDF